MNNKAMLATTLILAALSAPAAANAAPLSEDATVQTAVVTTADLNLARDEGQSTLKARIAGAVNRVCGTSTGTMALTERQAVNACRAKAQNAALADARMRGGQALAQR